MKLITVLKLAEALRSVSELPRGAKFYLQGDYPWTVDSLCYIVYFEDEEYGTEIEHEFISQYGVQKVLEVTEVDGTIAFALDQIPDAGDQLLVDSFNFYRRNDALLIFGEDDDT